MLAAIQGHVSIVRRLLRAGADVRLLHSRTLRKCYCVAWWLTFFQPNLVGKRGYTALHYACERHHYEVAVALKEGGADLYRPNSDGRTPLDLCSRDLRDVLEGLYTGLCMQLRFCIN